MKLKQRFLSAVLVLCLCFTSQSAAHAFPRECAEAHAGHHPFGMVTYFQRDTAVQEGIFTETAADESVLGDDVIPVPHGELPQQANVLAETSTSRPALYDSTVPTPTQIYDAMIAMKDKAGYTEGTTWTDYEPYSESKGYYHWKGGLIDGKNIVAVGCVAFAFTLSDEAFGSLPARMYPAGQFTYEDIKVGDILRTNTDTHTVIVLEVNPAGLVVAEGNYSGKVHWGRTISKEEFTRDASSYITRYPEGYIAPDDPTANTSIGSGTLNGGLSWNLTKAGTLTISGKGAMPDYSSVGEQPWNKFSSQIRTVIIEDGITNIGSCAFWECGVLDVKIPSSVTTIGNSAFRNSSIISVDIPSSVKTIGDSAFRTCQNLNSVTFSEGLETIVQNAFNGCTRLTSIDLPASIGEVGDSAFFQCTSMTDVTFAPGNKQVKMGQNMFMQCQWLISVKLPTSIDCISKQMFQSCAMLAGVEIPKGTKSIEESAFASCRNFTTVIIPDSITDIQRSAFSNCALTDIYFTGTQNQWNTGIWIASDSKTEIAKATIHYNFDPTATSGTVKLKDGTAVTLANDTLIYGEPLSNLQFNSAEFVDADNGNTVTGTLAWKAEETVPAAGTATAVWVFTPDDKNSKNYLPLEGTAAITVKKAVPYIAVLPTAGEITYGNSLSASVLTGGTAQHGNGLGQAGEGTNGTQTVSGTFTWKEPSVKPALADSNNTEFTVIFTPSDTDNYETAEAGITLTILKAGNAPNMPGTAMDVSNSIQKVGDILLPEGWAWQDADQDKPLEDGAAVTAVAVYIGADKGSYENETVTITITTSACDHEPGDILYTGNGEKAPTCTETGLGHRECTKCGSIVESGIVRDALGHDYTGTVTKEPTVTEEGVMTYTCSRCGDSYTSPIDKLPDNGSSNPEEPGGDQPDDNQPDDNKPGDNKPGDDQPGDNKPGDNQPDNNRPGNNKPDNSQPGNNNPGQETRPDTGIPFIKGENGKFGWDVIRAEEENAGESSVIHVDMNGISVVPGDIFDRIKGRNVTITFDMGNGIVWSVDGTTVTAGQAADIDFSVRTGANTIPANLVNSAVGGGYGIQLSLSHEGEFGFTAVLSINLGKEYAGRSAALYYYNPGTSALELICRETTAEDGTVRLTFTHASEYLLVLDSTAGSGTGSVTSGAQTTAPKSGDWESGKLWWILMAGALAVIISISWQEKRKKQ